MARRPRMSVLLPLQDERDAGEACVRAWADGQSAAADSYEILALAPGEDPELERAVRPLLRPQDRWIVVRGADEYTLFNRGAEAARGEFVFITEAHCVPEPDCLAAMLEELDGSGAPGVRGASVPTAHGALGVLERDAFEEALRVEEDPDHWRKVLIHSLAIRRELYLEAGGLPPRFGDFAPWVLAIALHARGQRLRFSPRPRVRHVYDGDLVHLGAHVRSFGHGEMRYRCERPGELSDRYLDWSTEWEQRLQTTRAGAARALGTGLALRHRGALRAMLRHAAVAVSGARGPIAAARVGAMAAAVRVRVVRDPERRLRGFLDFWRLTSRRGRLEGLAACPPDPGPPLAASDLDLTRSLAGRVIGFYDPEHQDGAVPYRWTEPLALLSVRVPGQGRARARLELHPLRPRERPARARVAVDGRVVASRKAGNAIEFELPAGERRIALAGSPFRGPGDPRALGLCVRALAFEPA